MTLFLIVSKCAVHDGVHPVSSVQRHGHLTQKGFVIAGIKTKMEPMKYASFWILKRIVFYSLKNCTFSLFNNKLYS